MQPPPPLLPGQHHHLYPTAITDTVNLLSIWLMLHRYYRHHYHRQPRCYHPPSPLPRTYDHSQGHSQHCNCNCNCNQTSHSSAVMFKAVLVITGLGMLVSTTSSLGFANLFRELQSPGWPLWSARTGQDQAPNTQAAALWGRGTTAPALGTSMSRKNVEKSAHSNGSILN